jgi:amino acid adenylation domain-containing protein
MTNTFPTHPTNDRRDWLRSCNGVTRDFHGESRVDLAFEAHVLRQPNAVAMMMANGDHITYHELDQRANRLAHLLRQRGAQPGDLIGICLERGPLLPIAVFAVLKAGCAYVPLDPTYPAERLSFMRHAARTRLTINDATETDERTVHVEDPQLAIFPHDAPPLGPRSADDIIYVIFTSGSTGQPKGAGVFHRGFTNLMRWFIDEFTITATDRVLMMSSFSFDLTQKNIFAPLMTGGQLHFAPNGHYEPSALTAQIRQHGITLINCTPSAFYPFLQSDNALANLSSLRTVFLGGEPIAPRRLVSWQQANAFRCDIANTYGPTECTDICVFHRVEKTEYTDGSVTVPIGRPVPNTAIAILTPDGIPCVADEEGELWVAGIGLGVGYVNDAALTAERFIANPFPELPGDRLYRTGDLARWRADGKIDYLGRLDHQVKIRGFRIELGEIEATLESFPAVNEAVVIARPMTNGELRLIAYMVERNGMTVDQPLLRAHLNTRLPEHMIPAVWMTLAKMPLSPNGKVDRRALPDPAQTSAMPVAGTISTTENMLMTLWCRVLETSSIDPEASFFDLGASSLHVAEVHGELVRQHTTLPITALYQFPTIRLLARHLSDASTADSGNDITERARRQLAARRRPPPLSSP